MSEDTTPTTTKTGIEELDNLIELMESIKTDTIMGFSGNLGCKKAARRARGNLMLMKKIITPLRNKIQGAIKPPKA